jgi:hypothetical protein
MPHTDRIEKREKPNGRPVTILLVDQDYQISYWILQDKTKIVSCISLTQAIELLKSKEFDLILSEPQNMAILKPTSKSEDSPAGKSL